MFSDPQPQNKKRPNVVTHICVAAPSFPHAVPHPALHACDARRLHADVRHANKLVRAPARILTQTGAVASRPASATSTTTAPFSACPGCVQSHGVTSRCATRPGWVTRALSLTAASMTTTAMTVRACARRGRSQPRRTAYFPMPLTRPNSTQSSCRVRSMRPSLD